MVKVLFVCLGNICRSPLAEGLLAHHAQQQGFAGRIVVDSCGTGGWHAGELPDPRTRKVAAAHGVALPSRARQIRAEDFLQFDYLIPMDRKNLSDLQDLMRLSGKTKAELLLMRQFDELAPGTDVPDPYYGDLEDFYRVFEILDRSTRRLLAMLSERHGLQAL